MKKDVISIIIIFLFLLNCYFIYRNTKKKLNLIKIEVATYKAKNEKLEGVLLEMIKNQNIRISKNIKVLNKKLDTLSLGEIINEPMLVFYFNEYSCMPCIDKILKVINERAKYSSIKLIILSKYDEAKDMVLFYRVNKTQIPVFNLTQDLPLPASHRNIPFIFYIDNSMRVNNLLTIEKSDIKFLKEYFALYEYLFREKTY